MGNPNAAANLTAPRWKPGQSGNARGANRGYRRVLKASRAASLEAIETAIAIMRDPEQPAVARLKACELVLDRGWGAPDQALRVEAREEGTKSITIQFVGADGTLSDTPRGTARQPEPPAAPLRLVRPDGR